MTHPPRDASRLHRALALAGFIIAGAVVAGLILQPAPVDPGEPATGRLELAPAGDTSDDWPLGGRDTEQADGMRVFDGLNRSVALRFPAHAREITRREDGTRDDHRRLEPDWILRAGRPTVVVVAAQYCSACKGLLRALQPARLPPGVDLLVWTDYSLPEQQQPVIDAIGARPARLVQGGMTGAELTAWIDSMFPGRGDEIPVVAVLDGTGKVMRAWQSNRLEIVEQIVRAASGMRYDARLPAQTAEPLPLPLPRPPARTIARPSPASARPAELVGEPREPAIAQSTPAPFAEDAPEDAAAVAEPDPAPPSVPEIFEDMPGDDIFEADPPTPRTEAQPPIAAGGSHEK